MSHADDWKSELLRRARLHAAQLTGRDLAHAPPHPPPRTTSVYKPASVPRPSDDPAHQCAALSGIARSGDRFWIQGQAGDGDRHPWNHAKASMRAPFRGGACDVQGEAPLLVPDVLVCSVGTEIFFECAGQADREWSAELDRGWDRRGALAAAAAVPTLRPQVRRWRRVLSRQPYLPRPRPGRRGCNHTSSELHSSRMAAAPQLRPPQFAARGSTPSHGCAAKSSPRWRQTTSSAAAAHWTARVPVYHIAPEPKCPWLFASPTLAAGAAEDERSQKSDAFRSFQRWSLR